MTTTRQEAAAPAQVKRSVSAIGVYGLVDTADGHAFVRTADRRGPDDVYVSAGQIQQYGLRKGLDRGRGAPRQRPCQ